MNFYEIGKELTEVDIEEAEAFRKTQETVILVIMFIDMARSTETREKMGEVQFEKLRRKKKQALTSIIERGNKGKVVKDLGDGLLGIFALPDVAVKSALEIQEELTSDPSFRVRIGLDMGEVTQETEQGIVKDVFGRHVNRAARIEALSEGGHILASSIVWDSAKGWLKHLDHIAWKKYGSYWLKGIAESQEVFEPYNKQHTEPLSELEGKKATSKEEWLNCKLCGRSVKRTKTFRCRTCGSERICTEYCFNSTHRQCIECASKEYSRIPFDTQKLIDLQNLDLK